MDPCLFGHLSKGAVVVVVIEEVVAVEIGDVEVRIPIVIIIACDHCLREGNPVDPGGMGNVFKGPVAPVAKEPAGTSLIAYKQVEVTVVVDIGPGCGL